MNDTTQNINFLDAVLTLSNQSKYTKWYIGIIKNAQSRNFKSRKEAKELLGYTERHHILPLSIGGDNNYNNLVYLTAKEHFISHYLLTKMFNNTNHKEKMLHAFWPFVTGEFNHNRNINEKITAKIFNTIKEKMSGIMSKHNSGVNNHCFGKFGEDHPAFGNKMSDENRKKISEAQQGEKNSFFGRTHSEETLQRISIAVSGEKNGFYGKTHSEEAKRKNAEAHTGENSPMFGKTHTEEARKLMSIANKGKILSNETKQKISDANKISLKGVPKTKEHIEKIANSNRGKTRSPQAIENLKIAKRKEKEKDKLLISTVIIWLQSNTLPQDIIYTGKKPKSGGTFYEKLFYAKELIKRGLMTI